MRAALSGLLPQHDYHGRCVLGEPQIQVHLEPQIVTIFGNRVLADITNYVKRRSYWISGPESSDWRHCGRKEREIQAHHTRRGEGHRVGVMRCN